MILNFRKINKLLFIQWDGNAVAFPYIEDLV
jgi:hypothetical protein